MKLYVMRHGETIPNTLHKISGQKECDLTKRGIQETKKLKEKLKDINFDIILTSPLSRARITASIIADKPIIIDKRLIERDYGSFEMKRKSQIAYKEFWNYEDDLKVNGGESIKDFFYRVSSLIQGLNQKYSNKTVLLVTHGGVARAIHYYITGIPKNNDLTVLKVPNCSVRVYEIKEVN